MLFHSLTQKSINRCLLSAYDVKGTRLDAGKTTADLGNSKYTFWSENKVYVGVEQLYMHLEIVCIEVAKRNSKCHQPFSDITLSLTS